MLDAVDAKLRASYAECTGLQILNLELTDKRENAIINSQVARQT